MEADTIPMGSLFYGVEEATEIWREAAYFHVVYFLKEQSKRPKVLFLLILLCTNGLSERGPTRDTT